MYDMNSSLYRQHNTVEFICQMVTLELTFATALNSCLPQFSAGASFMNDAHTRSFIFDSSLLHRLQMSTKLSVCVGQGSREEQVQDMHQLRSTVPVHCTSQSMNSLAHAVAQWWSEVVGEVLRDVAHVIHQLCDVVFVHQTL